MNYLASFTEKELQEELERRREVEYQHSLPISINKRQMLEAISAARKEAASYDGDACAGWSIVLTKLGFK